MLSEFPTKHASSSVLLSSSFGYVLLCKLTSNGLPFKRFLRFKNVVKLITFNLVDITLRQILLETLLAILLSVNMLQL